MVKIVLLIFLFASSCLSANVYETNCVACHKKIPVSIDKYFYRYLLTYSSALYKKCAGCHGQTGEKVALGKSKVIKDMSKADIVVALKGYKDGTYGG